MRGAWAHVKSAAEDSEPPGVAPLGGRVEAQNPPRFSRNSLLKMEAPSCTEPASLGACGRSASGTEAAVRVPDPEARAGAGHPRLRAAPQPGLTSPRPHGPPPASPGVTPGGQADGNERFVRVLPSPLRPTLPRRIIGYLISPGLNSWQRGRWFATGNKT